MLCLNYFQICKMACCKKPILIVTPHSGKRQPENHSTLQTHKLCGSAACSLVRDADGFTYRQQTAPDPNLQFAILTH